MREVFSKFVPTLLAILCAAAAAMGDEKPRVSFCTPSRAGEPFACRETDDVVRAIHAVPAGAPYAIEGKEIVFAENSQREVRPVAAAFTAAGVSGTATLTLQRQSPRQSWVLALPLSRLETLSGFRLATGSYSLAITSPHSARVERSFSVPETSALRTIVIAPLPKVSGAVVDAAGKRLVNAAVLEDGRTVATTDSKGRFTYEVAGEWPGLLTIAYPGYADARVDIPKTRASVQLPQTTLSGGGSLAVQLTGAAASEEGITVQLKVPDPDSSDTKTVAVRTLTVGTATALFEHMQPGTYRLLISGRGALQRFGADVEIRDLERTEKQIAIAAAQLKLKVRKGTSAVAGAEVRMHNHEGGWTGILETGDDGVAAAELWQSGEFMSFVTVRNLPPFVDTFSLPAEREVAHELRLPSASIGGVVLSAADAVPIAHAMVSLSMHDAESSKTLRTRTDDDGKYRFDFIATGHASVKADAAGYLPSDAVEIDVTDPDAPLSANVKLQRGIVRHVHVANGAGVPLAAAEVVAANASGSLTYATSGADGTADVATAANAVIYVIPREGSFAVRRLGSNDADLDLQIVVPDGTCSLLITAETEGGQPVREMSVFFRYNGEIVPNRVMWMLSTLQGLHAETGADGRTLLNHLPAGYYEIWPLTSASGTDDDYTSGLTYTRPPVAMNVRPGENAATLRFRGKKRA